MTGVPDVKRKLEPVVRLVVAAESSAQRKRQRLIIGNYLRAVACSFSLSGG